MSSSLIIFGLIVLSYFYTSSHPIEQVKIKQSQGWETFVLLGMNSIRVIVNSIPLILILWGILFLISLLFSICYHFIFGTGLFAKLLSVDAITSSPLREIIFSIVIITVILGNITFIIKNFKNQNNNKKLKQLRKKIADGKIRIIIDALISQTPVKISLKSRKVYIGIVIYEYFEANDLNNIIIIPYFSGYRDKDTLKLYLDTNYAAIYVKNNIDKFINFRHVISSSEVESISLFYLEYFEQFANDNISSSSN